MTGRNITADTTKGHAALFYESPEEQLEILAQFFKDGIEQNELCIYVSSQPTEDILEQFAAHGFDARPAVTETNLRIFEMDKTYMPNGQFVANYMLHNLQDFIDDAKAAGYHGLRYRPEVRPDPPGRRPGRRQGTAGHEQNKHGQPQPAPDHSEHH